MATITKRQKKDGSASYTAQIRIRREGKIVHSEAATWPSMKLAREWARQRETELSQPGALDKKESLTVRDAIDWYAREVYALREWGRSKAAELQTLGSGPLAGEDVTRLTVTRLMQHVTQRRDDGAAPSTAGKDLTWLHVVCSAVRALRGIDARCDVIRDAQKHGRLMQLIAPANRRERRLSADEEHRLLEFFASADLRAQIPMATIMRFALLSARRLSEIVGLRWDDLNESDHSVLVRDLKHPRHPKGYHKRAKLLIEAWDLIQSQPRINDRIFPFRDKSIGNRWAQCCIIIGIDDLHFHDLRHEATCRLFERGYPIHEVVMFTLHESWITLRRYTHLRPSDVPQR